MLIKNHGGRSSGASERIGSLVSRPPKPRWVGFNPQFTFFGPQRHAPMDSSCIILGVDELEALRLSDLDGLSQMEAAARMNVSRATFGRIVEQARRKVAGALVYGTGISVGGGNIMFHPPAGRRRRGRGPHGPHGRGKGPWR